MGTWHRLDAVAGSLYQRAIACGPATDFRGERIPKTGSLADPILTGWAARPYLKSTTEVIMAKPSPFKFFQDVRTEADKVTWPTRRETFITTIMVFVMVAATSIFFTVADQIIRVVITYILGVAG